MSQLFIELRTVPSSQYLGLPLPLEIPLRPRHSILILGPAGAPNKYIKNVWKIQSIDSILGWYKGTREITFGGGDDDGDDGDDGGDGDDDDDDAG